MWESVVKAAMQSATPATPLTQGRAVSEQEAAQAGEGDFATEAAYSRPGLLQRPAAEPSASVEGHSETASARSVGPRGNAPVIGEKHVWGVVDGWGEKAGKWGKGPKAFDDK